MIEWLDCEPSHHAWAIIEEAARLQSIVYGMACALSVMYDRAQGYDPCDADAQVWIAYIEDFAECNYDAGRRIG